MLEIRLVYILTECHATECHATVILTECHGLSCACVNKMVALFSSL